MSSAGTFYVDLAGTGTAATIAGNLELNHSGVFYVAGTDSSARIDGNVINPGFFFVGGTGVSATVAGNFTGGYFEALSGGHVNIGGTLLGGFLVEEATANVNTVVTTERPEIFHGGIVSTAKVTSTGFFHILTGGTLVVGSGSPPSGTSGYYQFANGTLAEIIPRTPAENGNTCTGFGDCGFIIVDGPVHLAGVLDPVLENGFDPANGESFIFMTFAPGELTGTFSSVADNGSQYWRVTYGTDFVELTYAAPEPGTPLLMGAGLAGLAIFARRRSKNR